MNTTRRAFLKGTLATAAVAALGFPGYEPTHLIVDIESWGPTAAVGHRLSATRICWHLYRGSDGGWIETRTETEELT